jgi:hypothetical protein
VCVCVCVCVLDMIAYMHNLLVDRFKREHKYHQHVNSSSGSQIMKQSF